MRVINWNACDASYVVAGSNAVQMTCDKPVHCAPEDASAEHRDPSGVRWRYPEDEELGD